MGRYTPPLYRVGKMAYIYFQRDYIRTRLLLIPWNCNVFNINTHGRGGALLLLWPGRYAVCARARRPTLLRQPRTRFFYICCVRDTNLFAFDGV